MKLFLSHSWDDKPMVYDLASQVEAVVPGVDIWLDGDVVRPGDEILSTVERGLRECDLMVLVWTPSSARSDGVAHEIHFAARNGIRVVPCVVGGRTDPPPLPAVLGKLPHHLRIDDATDRRDITLAAGAIAELLADRGAADPEVQLDAGPLWSQLLRFGANLRHSRQLADGPTEAARPWAGVLRRDLEQTAETAQPVLDGLARSQDLLSRVVTAVERRPTDDRELARLRAEAVQLLGTDRAGATQAVKVIDLRRSDPLR
ncbi:MAG: toll/interleukin-1 receptor domain-containing protein [Actinomycetota bacterium]